MLQVRLNEQIEARRSDDSASDNDSTEAVSTLDGIGGFWFGSDTQWAYVPPDLRNWVDQQLPPWDSVRDSPSAQGTEPEQFFDGRRGRRR